MIFVSSFAESLQVQMTFRSVDLFSASKLSERIKAKAECDKRRTYEKMFHQFEQMNEASLCHTKVCGDICSPDISFQNHIKNANQKLNEELGRKIDALI